MSTVKVVNIQHPDAAEPAITLDASGNASVAGVGFTQEYNIGDTGPGGGKIFYVSPGGFLSGTDGNETICHYLEAWTTDLETSDDSVEMQWSGASGPLGMPVGTSLRIGAGAANTARAVAQNDTADRAITVANSFENNGLSDWFLPSKHELDEMHFHKNVIGGFSNFRYWSSSEANAVTAWFQGFFGGERDGNNKGSSNRVRPVRAF